NNPMQPASGDEGSTSIAPSASESTSEGSTSSSSSTTSTTANPTTAVDEDSSSSAAEGPLSDGGTVAEATNSGCGPVSNHEMLGDGIDDDCNGKVDDVDLGADGICDCLIIALLGEPGPLASSFFEGWLAMQGTSVDRIDPDTLDAEALAPYTVIIMDM